MTKPTVCFITPPSPFLLDERVFPSLGILKVAAVTERLGYPVEHLDLNGVENYEDAVANYCYQTSAKIFALTATTPQMVAATRIRNRIKSILPSSKIILGGPHPTLTHAAFQQASSERAVDAMTRLIQTYDVVVAGDGELAIERAIVDSTHGLINADDPKSDLFLSSKVLGELPLPARHLVDLDSYKYIIDDVRVTALIGQLGCPFACNFCAGRDSAMLRRVRLRPTASVIAEMRELYTVYGIHGFMFFDDELNVNRQFIELLREIDKLQHELGVEFRCRGFVKSELFTDEQAMWMYRAGFRCIMCGFESGNDRILKNIRKNATKDDNTRTMEISHKHDLGMKALMSVGHPGESAETIEDTLTWLKHVEPADFDVTIITAYPGSPYYDKAVRTGRKWGSAIWTFEVEDAYDTRRDRLHMFDIDYTQVEDFYKGAVGAYKSYVFTDYITEDELVRLRDVVEHEVRGALGIPYYQASAAVRFEASMGQGQLPGVMFRKSGDVDVNVKEVSA